MSSLQTEGRELEKRKEEETQRVCQTGCLLEVLLRRQMQKKMQGQPGRQRGCWRVHQTRLGSAALVLPETLIGGLGSQRVEAGTELGAVMLMEMLQAPSLPVAGSRLPT